jgi:hypothetical protein
MLAIRKQKPMNLSSASIFELDAGGPDQAAGAHFRLFPIIAQAEQPWLRSVARIYPNNRDEAGSWPIALLDEYIWGAPAAGNVLSDNLWCLAPQIAQVLPELANCVTRRAGGGQVQQVDSRTWKLLSAYFKPPQEGVPNVLRSEQWFTHRLVSAAGGWVDAQCAIAPEKLPEAKAEAADAANGAKPGAEAATADGVTGVPTAATAGAPQAVPRRISKGVPYHYLEPSVDLYRALEADANKIQADLTASKYLPDKYKSQFADWTRLFQRLTKIAEMELRQMPLSVVDKKLLGNIDQILDRVDTPLPAVLPIEAPQRPIAGKPKEGEQQLAAGMNFAVGRPGQLYVIYQNPHNMEWTLGRGAVYTYYEMPSPLLTDTMWLHRIEAGFAQPVNWSQKFQVVQHEAPAAKAPTTTAAR